MSTCPLRATRLAFAAALLLACASSPALAAGVPVAGASAEQKADAGAAYKAAKVHLDAGRLDEALVGFRGSYDIVASPNSLFMVVRTLQDLGRVAEAYRAAQDVVQVAERAAAVSPKYAKTAAAAKDKLTELEALVGFLTVTVDSPPGWTLSVNGMATPEEAIADRLAVDPGTVEVQLTTPSGTETKQVEVAAGASATLTIAPPAPLVQEEPDEGPDEEPDDGEGPDALRISAYAALGVGAAGMIVFGVFGGLTLSEFSTLEDECGGGTCSADDSAKGDDGRTFQTVANVGLVVGAVGLAAGAGLLITSLVQQDDEGGDSASAGPQLIVGPGSVMVTGSF